MDRDDDWRQQQEQEEMQMREQKLSRPLDDLLDEHRKHLNDLEAILWSEES
mgnify:CR=1 FL=1|jgi:hypothetical protein